MRSLVTSIYRVLQHVHIYIIHYVTTWLCVDVGEQPESVVFVRLITLTDSNQMTITPLVYEK